MATQEIERRRRYIRPACQVLGTDDRVEVLLEMPGVTKEGLEIKVENNELIVLGKRDSAAQDQNYLLRERRDGDFHQVYTLDETVAQNHIDAQLSMGVLRITLPIKEAEKPRLIKVKAT